MIEATHGNYVYQFIGRGGEVLYVGVTTNMVRRVKQHYKTGRLSTEINKEMLSHILWSDVGNKQDMMLIEHYLISRHNPQMNVSLKYNVSNLLMDISTVRWNITSKRNILRHVFKQSLPIKIIEKVEDGVICESVDPSTEDTSKTAAEQLKESLEMIQIRKNHINNLLHEISTERKLLEEATDKAARKYLKASTK